MTVSAFHRPIPGGFDPSESLLVAHQMPLVEINGPGDYTIDTLREAEVRFWSAHNPAGSPVIDLANLGSAYSDAAWLANAGWEECAISYSTSTIDICGFYPGMEPWVEANARSGGLDRDALELSRAVAPDELRAVLGAMRQLRDNMAIRYYLQAGGVEASMRAVLGQQALRFFVSADGVTPAIELGDIDIPGSSSDLPAGYFPRAELDRIRALGRRISSAATTLLHPTQANTSALYIEPRRRSSRLRRPESGRYYPFYNQQSTAHHYRPGRRR